MATIQLSTEAMIGVVAGSVIGGILLLLSFGLCGYFCCCRRKRSDKPPKRIVETRSNDYASSAASSSKFGPLPRRQLEDGDTEKTVGYAYPIVAGRPVSYPYFGAVNNMMQKTSSSPPSSYGEKSAPSVKRQASIPPNAYRLPGLADKSFSMSDSNLSVVGTLNPAYDENGDDEHSSDVYRTQSLMHMNRQETDLHQYDSRQIASLPKPAVKLNVYQFDGSYGEVTNTSLIDGSLASSSRRNPSSPIHEEVPQTSSSKVNSLDRVDRELRRFSSNVSLTHELEASDHIYALPNKQKVKAKAPDVPGPPKGLPRIPLDSHQEEAESPKSPQRFSHARRSLTSEMSFQTKGNIVTDQAFDFLDGYAEESPKS